MSSGPVFLKAIPRSGGTLFVTLMDAHPQVSMSYEIYEDRLFDGDGNPLSIVKVIDWLDQHKNNSKDDIQWIKNLPDNNLRVFLFRARRGGLIVAEMLEALKDIVQRKKSFLTSTGRLDFIEELMQKKAQKAGKTIWGGKTQANLYDLHERHPDACFFIMRRDVRDMFASMLNKGSFTYTAKEAAELWKERILEFQNFVATRKPKAMEVCYESLAREPETVLPEICRLIGVEYDPAMLDFHNKDLTLFKSPHGHLSSEQLKQGLNTSSIGRWKNDLSARDVDTIMSIAGDLIDE